VATVPNSVGTKDTLVTITKSALTSLYPVLKLACCARVEFLRLNAQFSLPSNLRIEIVIILPVLLLLV